MRSFARVLLPLALVTVAVSCSGSKHGSSSNPYGTEQKFCEQWAKAACNAKVVAACAAASVASCVDNGTTYCMGLVAPHYNPKYAKQCIDAVRTAFADAKLTAEELATVRDMAAPCDRLNEGPLGEGDQCSASDQCDALVGDLGLRCIVKSGQTFGTCAEPVEVGGGFSCAAPNQVCVSGFYCDGSNCLAAKGEGEACDTAPCADGFDCQDVSGSLQCVAKLKATDACSADEQCASGICAKSVNGTGKCVDSVVLSPTDPMCSYLG
jgi:hypothetical protein